MTQYQHVVLLPVPQHLTPRTHTHTHTKLILTLNLNPNIHIRDRFDLVLLRPCRKRVNHLP